MIIIRNSHILLLSILLKKSVSLTKSLGANPPYALPLLFSISLLLILLALVLKILPFTMEYEPIREQSTNTTPSESRTLKLLLNCTLFKNEARIDSPQMQEFVAQDLKPMTDLNIGFHT